MLFAAHDEDGRIYMANKVYDPAGYDKLLREHGHDKFVVHESPGIRSPDLFYARNGSLTKRPWLDITVDKTTIKAGSSDAAVFRGIQPGTRLRVVATGVEIHNMILTDPEAELPIPVPCTYTVIFEKWPFRTRVFQIEAIV